MSNNINYYYNTDLACNLTQPVNPLLFITNDLERMRISNLGLIGVANSSPSGKLDVNGTIVVRNNGIVMINGSGNHQVRPVTAGVTSNEICGLSSATFDISGNIISGSDEGQLRLSAGGATGTSNKSYIDLYGANSCYMSFVTSSSERMCITSTGVGIGTGSTVTSGSILDVNGVTNFRGNILPDTSGTKDIGNSSYMWNNVYCNQGYISGSLSRGSAVTITSSTYIVLTSDNWIICNGTGTITVTLPTASLFIGRELMFKNITTQLVNSNASNVYPINSGTLGTQILPATAGSSATLVSDGTNWVIMR
jgi:hypothetical protein